MNSTLIVETLKRQHEEPDSQLTGMSRKLVRVMPEVGAVRLKNSFYLQSCQRISKMGKQQGYMTEAERDKYRVRVHKGKLYNYFGEIVNGVYLFAFNTNMNLYVAEEHQNPEVTNHDYLTAGLPVRGTGFLGFKNGRLVAVSNNSGHYVPTVHQMWQALSLLYRIFGEEQFQQVTFEVWRVEDQRVHKSTFRAIDVLKHLQRNLWRATDEVDWFNLTNVWVKYNDNVNLGALFPDDETLSSSSCSSDDDSFSADEGFNFELPVACPTEDEDYEMLEGDDGPKSTAEESRFGARLKGSSDQPTEVRPVVLGAKC